MAEVHIIEIPDGIDVDIETKGSRVFINGAEVDITENCKNISVKVKGATLRDVKSSGSVHCDDVEGNVDAKGSVQCDDVGGSVNAGGSVRCGKISGSVNAGGSIRGV
jgi:hypothetical protein